MYLMKLLRIFVLLSIISVFFSCKKKVTDYNPNLIGYWQGTDGFVEYSITIVEEGKSVYYENWSDTAYVEAKGVAKISVNKDDNDILIIGKKEFTIVEDNNISEGVKYPSEILGTDHHWEITLDGIDYRKDD